MPVLSSATLVAKDNDIQISADESWDTLLNQAILAVKDYQGEIVVTDLASCLPSNIMHRF